MQTTIRISQIKKCLCLIGLASLIAFSNTAAWAQKKSVAVTSVIEHPALDAVRDGIKLELEKAGYQDGKNLRWQYQTAQGSVSTAAQIARKYVGDQPDVIVAISTPSAQTALAATKNIPIVFSAITDPEGGKLIKNWQPSNTNVTGVSNVLDVNHQIDLILEVAPNAKRIGVVYNPAEANAVYYVNQLKELLPQRNMTLQLASAPRTVDVGTATQSLVGKIDVLYAVSDNNVVAAFESMVKVANANKIPIISTDPLTAERGSTIAMGVDYIELGRQTGRQVIRILNGEKPGDIAPEKGQKIDLFVNLKAAKAQGVSLPQSIIDRATRLID